MSYRDGMDAQTQGIISALVITTFWAIKLEFASRTCCLWTGPSTITATGSGDPTLDGLTFDSISNGVIVTVGDNSMNYSGSDQLDIAIGIPSTLSTEISAVDALAAEWRARTATMWRCFMIQPATNTTAPCQWVWKRVRTGSMDNVLWSSDGSTTTLKLSIESHASLISQASGSTYNDQAIRFDANDTSQEWAASLANGGSLPTRSVATSTGVASSGGFHSNVSLY